MAVQEWSAKVTAKYLLSLFPLLKMFVVVHLVIKT